MKEKKYCRWFKCLENIFLFLISFVLSLFFWELCYRHYADGIKIKMLLPYIMMTIANFGLSFSVVTPAITSFNKISLKNALKEKNRKIIYVLTIIILTFAMTVICHWWFQFGYGPIHF